MADAAGGLWARLAAEPARPDAVRTSRLAQWLVVGTVCVGAFMGQLDASIVTLTLPTLRRVFHASLADVEWVALAYLVVLVATVVAIGRLGDVVGRKLHLHLRLRRLHSRHRRLRPGAVAGRAGRLPHRPGAGRGDAAGQQRRPDHHLAAGRPARCRARPAGRRTGARPRARAHRRWPAHRCRRLALGLLRHGACGRRRYGRRLVPSPSYQGEGRAGHVRLGRLGGVRPHRRGPAPRALTPGVGLCDRGPRCGLPGTGGAARRATAAATLAAGQAGSAGRVAVVPGAVRRTACGTVLRRGRPAPVRGQHRPLGHRAARSSRASPPRWPVPVPTGGEGDDSPWPAWPASPSRWRSRPSCSHSRCGLAALLALAGIGFGLFTPANNAAVMAGADPRQVGQVGGVLTMTRGLGTALGVAVTGLALAHGFRTASWLLAAVTARGCGDRRGGEAAVIWPDVPTPRPPADLPHRGRPAGSRRRRCGAAHHQAAAGPGRRRQLHCAAPSTTWSPSRLRTPRSSPLSRSSGSCPTRPSSSRSPWPCRSRGCATSTVATATRSGCSSSARRRAGARRRRCRTRSTRQARSTPTWSRSRTGRRCR